ncbi:esterase-like activity of phytase family protein [Allopontixanthobacter sp.]|uniref:esterase-like activity of phytase family protein n=1 Tax=Allopontixanthobacter sp. TaxID=2906452 RepID=UPI002AB84724|nr:esterase-like activity of phytase family protein [Allopontixanthobacter sp.]MDZ4308657.1 esterase-like activity of phytase family protein [Allopontixanthobacter sp.]
MSNSFAAWRRPVLIALLALALAPATWIRHELPDPDYGAPVIFARLGVPVPMAGEVEVLRAWKATSNSDHFGGYSALVATGEGQLIAASDRGRIMQLSLPGNGSPAARLSYLPGLIKARKQLFDIESMTRDPASGQVWLGYEGINTVERRDSRLENARRVRPLQMQDWPDNKGAEAMVRLADGRFILLAEGSTGRARQTFRGLLFASDPVEDPHQIRAAKEFGFQAPSGYRPVDMAQIPDGRVLILVRRMHWQVMPRFTAKLVLADPAAIVPGRTWSGRVIAEFAPPLPSDNYEGLALWPRADGTLDLWLISDDNRTGFQSTYLLEMRWNPQTGAPRATDGPPNEKARSRGRAP